MYSDHVPSVHVSLAKNVHKGVQMMYSLKFLCLILIHSDMFTDASHVHVGCITLLY